MTDQRTDEPGSDDTAVTDETLVTSEAEEVGGVAPEAVSAAQTPAAVEQPGDAGTVPGGATEAAEAVADGTVAAGAADSDADGEGGDAGDGEAEHAGDAPNRRGDRRARLEREGEVAADFLETLLDICDLDGDLDVDIDGDRAAVSIVDSDEGRVPRRLVGQDGQVLEALQELTRLAVQSETGERSRLMLDVAGHRAGRRATLVEQAKAAISEVKASGSAASLEPMTAFERKVVHDEVLAAGLHSESEGSEPRRYVVIHPAS